MLIRVQSLGEYAALVAAGVLTIETGLRLIARRVCLMTERRARNETRLLLVRLAGQAFEQAIASVDDYQGITSLATMRRLKPSSEVPYLSFATERRTWSFRG